MDILWGLVFIVTGVFISAYGGVLFRFALAALGFGMGAILAWWLSGSQPELTRILISLGVGGIAGALLYMLVRVGVYVAGGVLGLVLAFLVVSILGIKNTAFDAILLVAGTGLAGYFGPRLGRMITILAMAAAGAFQVVYGLALIFAGQVAEDAAPTELLGQPLALAVFLTVAAISALSYMRPRVGVIQPVR
ncbi:MAG: DUF4203 domain-containing protein [Caldilineaceae bacterium]|nr:DUF4203 domain-containing protein [Caldilineaceae bacterium]RIK33094.1 MAG: hypothetical protein DCC57_25350 [Chloroflexota bacterium]